MTLLLEDIDLLSPAEHAAVDAYRDAGPDERRLIARLALAEEATRAGQRTSGSVDLSVADVKAFLREAANSGQYTMAARQRLLRKLKSAAAARKPK